MRSIRYEDEQQKVKPLLTWRLQNLNLTQNFYKDSEPFFHEGIFWKLFVSKLNDKECQIGLKYSQEFSRESQTRDAQVFFDKYSILSLLFWTKLENEPPFDQNILVQNQQNPIGLKNMTISATKSQLILRTIPLSAFDNQNRNDSSLAVEIFFQLKPIVSMIMNHITLSFGSLASWP